MENGYTSWDDVLLIYNFYIIYSYTYYETPPSVSVLKAQSSTLMNHQ